MNDCGKKDSFFFSFFFFVNETISQSKTTSSSTKKISKRMKQKLLERVVRRVTRERKKNYLKKEMIITLKNSHSSLYSSWPGAKAEHAFSPLLLFFVSYSLGGGLRGVCPYSQFSELQPSFLKNVFLMRDNWIIELWRKNFFGVPILLCKL